MNRANRERIIFKNLHFALAPTLTVSVLSPQMKSKPAKKYKRKLSREAIEAMRDGGKNGSVQQKSKAGKAGWQAMIKKVRSDEREWRRVERDIAKVK